MPHAPKPYLRSFGRVRGKGLRPRQQSLMDDLLPRLAVHAGAFTAKQPIAFEIGFGGGEHLAAFAKAKPDWLCIGAEPFENGVAKLLSKIEEEGLENIRIHMGDARDVLVQVPAGALDAVYILFPDPWPKAKHNKRRIINHELLAMLARTQTPGALLQIATDHVDYGAWILEHILASPYYEWQAKDKADWESPPAIWAETKYQRKTTAEGRKPMFIKCLRTEATVTA